MNLTGQQHLPVSQAQAWAALNDTTLLQATLPGCKAITSAGANAYDVRMVVSVGPVNTQFEGRLQLSELKAPQSYRMSFEGSGGIAGHGKGQALMQLQAVAPHDTVLSYDVSASIGGQLAQIGSGLVDLASQQLAADFFANFQAALALRYASARAAAITTHEPPRQAGLQRLRTWLRHLLD